MSGDRPKAPTWWLRWLALIAIGAAQWAWLGWFLSQPLPNAKKPDGTPWHRSEILWRFLPEVVPGLEWPDSFLGMAVEDLRHVGNLPERLPIVLAAGLIGGGAVAIGGLTLRAIGLTRAWSPLERLAAAYGIGMGALGVIALVAGRLGLLTPWTARVGLAIPIAIAAGLRVRDRSREPDEPDRTGRVSRSSMLGLALVVAPFLTVMLLGSMLPTVEFDAIEYHLQAPKEWFLAGRIGFLPHNVYASMPFGVEMVHLLGMDVIGDWWWGALVGQLLIGVSAPMAALSIWLAARRWASPRAAWVAVVVYLSAPWIYRIAAMPYVEGPLCAAHAAILWAVGMAWTDPDRSAWRPWLVAGLLAGSAMAIKYPALVSAVAPAGGVALVASARGRSVRPFVAFGVGVALIIGPWLIKNVIDTGNPVYPLGYRVFGGREWDEGRQAQWSSAHGPRPIRLADLGTSIVDVAGRSDWQSPAFAALAPLALLRPGSRRFAGAVLGLAVYLFLTWWLLTHRLDRFWLPLLPALAILAGVGADWTRWRAWTAALAFVLAVAIGSNLAYESTALAALNEWTADLAGLRRSVPRRINRSLALLDAELPPGARPLLVGQAAVFHLNRPVVYNTVFDRDIFESIDRDRTPAEVRDELGRRGITHIYVDWFEIDRYRSPGNYGFTPYVTPARFDRLVAAGVLAGPRSMGARQDLYEVSSSR